MHKRGATSFVSVLDDYDLHIRTGATPEQLVSRWRRILAATEMYLNEAPSADQGEIIVRLSMISAGGRFILDSSGIDEKMMGRLEEIWKSDWEAH